MLLDRVIEYTVWVCYFILLYFIIFWYLVFVTRPSPKRRKLTQFPLVTIAIPAWNEEKVIIPTIESVLKLDYPKEKVEIIVVNDGSTDNTKEIVQNFIDKGNHKNINLINKINGKKASAINAALTFAKGEYFVVFDADSEIDSNALKELLPHFDREEEVAAVLPWMKVKHLGKDMSTLQKMQHYEYILNAFYKELMGRLDSIGVIPGPFSVYKTSILRKIGGFDTAHNLTEDHEITLRIHKYNYKIIQTKDAFVHTIVPKNIKSLMKQRNRWYKGNFINMIRYRFFTLNPKYGDYGLMKLIYSFAGIAVTLILLTTFIYSFIKPWVNRIFNWSLIDFDIWHMFKNLFSNFSILDYKFGLFVLMIVSFGISIYGLKKSHEYAKDKLLRYGKLPAVFYLFLYFFLLAAAWVYVIVETVFMRKKDKRWLR